MCDGEATGVAGVGTGLCTRHTVSEEGERQRAGSERDCGGEAVLGGWDVGA